MKTILKNLVKRAIDSFNQNDLYLIEHNACERCICARLGYHLQAAVKRSRYYKDYVVDVEYNIGMDGNPYDRKRIHGHLTYVDIIVHKRGYDEIVGFDNLIAIEMKKDGMDFEEDKRRLEYLTSDKSGFGYKAGFALKVNFVNNCLEIESEYYYHS